jgi:DNA-binding transcriptional LysR family regulator
MERIQTFRIFARVAEVKSFTKAAESLGLPKASVSSQIQQLENELGTRLLQRTTRQVQLTHDGISFYERTKDLLSDVDELKTMFQSGPSDITGRIRVDMSSRMARFQIIPRLPEFIEVDLVHEGYDCVIRGGSLSDSSLIAKKLKDIHNINVASPSYLKKYGTPKSLKDLERHYLVEYVSTFGEKPEGFEYVEADKTRFIPMKSFVTVNNAESYIAACEAGLGIIQNPRGTLEESLKKKRLVEILPKYRAESMPIYLLYPHRRNLPRRVKVFMDWVETVVNEKN